MDKKQEFILKLNSNSFEKFVISANDYIDNDFVDKNFDSMVDCFKSFIKDYDLFKKLEEPHYNLFPQISCDYLINIIYKIQITEKDQEESPYLLSKYKLIDLIFTYKIIKEKDLDDIVRVKNKLDRIGKNGFNLAVSNAIQQETELNNIFYIFNKYINIFKVNSVIFKLYINSYEKIHLIISSFNNFEDFYNYIKPYCREYDYITTLVNVFYKKGLIEDSFIHNHKSNIDFSRLVYLKYIDDIYYVNTDFIYKFIDYIPIENLKIIQRINKVSGDKIKNKKLYYFIENHINKLYKKGYN